MTNKAKPSDIDIFKGSSKRLVTTTYGDIRRVYEIGHIDGYWAEHDDWIHTERPLTIKGWVVNDG